MQKEPAIVEPDDTKPRLILQSKSGELTYIEDGDPLAEILSNQQYPSLRNFSFKFESPEAQIQIPQTIPVSCNDMPYAHGPPPHKKQIIQHISSPHVPVRFKQKQAIYGNMAIVPRDKRRNSRTKTIRK